VNAGKLQQLPEEGHPFIRHHITRLVMTFAEASAGHKDAVRPCLQGLQDIMGRDRPGAHHPDDPDRGRILHSTDPSQVSGCISSPGTQKSYDFRLKLCHQATPFNGLTTKSEIRISKFETNPKFKYQNSKPTIGNICFLSLCACFGFRASNFEFPF
jgi:hypothetical protein